MPRITLPDGSSRQFSEPVSGADLAASIGPGLAKAAIAIKLNDVVKDLATVIEADAKVSIITERDDEALELIRHDAAHVLAEAVQQLFPGTQVTIGPNIENGFYYDFARDIPFSTDDLETIEAKMKEIVGRDMPFVREIWGREEALQYFEKQGEFYKAEIIRDLPENEDVSIYTQGAWTDLCRGPHMPSTGHIGKAFKLMKVAGAYWRGDVQNQMLQRIYGTAWRTPKELRQHLSILVEAEKRQYPSVARSFALGRFGPLGKIPREHVHFGIRGKGSCNQADELSLPCSDFQTRPEKLSRTSATHGGVWIMPQERTIGSATWTNAGSRFCSGRCTYLLP